MEDGLKALLAQRPAAPTDWPASPLMHAASAALLGAGLGLLAWSPGHTPALGVLFPLLWVTRRSRLAAFACAAAYHLAVVRFLPDLASGWFGSAAAGVACWVAVGLISAAAWALLWPRPGTGMHVVSRVAAVLIVLLLPPLGALVPAHPVVAWGFLVPGSGWGGVALMFLLTCSAAWWLRTATGPAGGQRVRGSLALLFMVVWTWGLVPQLQDGRSAGGVLAIQTQFGGFPEYGSLDVMQRLARMGEMAGIHTEQAVKTVVFPEGIVGFYDQSLQPAIDLELAGPVTSRGQTLVLGAELALGGSGFGNAAIIYRPYGSSTTINARQTAPVAQWRPWTSGVHFPADWLAPSTADIGGIRARFMFCHEEWMAVLHLLSEAREEHELVVALANLWSAQDSTASYVQGAHTQGMALLFGRTYVRAVNGTRETKQP
jgi:hypothetical protein